LSGFVAIIWTQESAPTDEIDTLAKAYTDLRGPALEQRLSAAGRVDAIRFESWPSRHPAVERRSDSWALAVGAIHHDQPLLSSRLEDLEGQFALLIYDAQSGAVTVASDPFGMQALYWARRDGTTYVSTSCLTLARHLQAPLSEIGVHTYLRTGMQFGALTNWEGISRLDPATSLRFEQDRLNVEQYWRPELDGRIGGLDLERAAGHCIEVAAELFARCFGGAPTWADLTAGFDTRLLTLLMDHAGVELHAETRRTTRSLDPIIAERVARAAGWDWQALEVPREWLPQLRELAPVALGWGDGNIDVLTLSRDLWVHRLLGRERPSLLNGVGGDHFRSHAWRQEFFLEGRSSRVNWDNLLDMRLIHSMDTSVFARDPTADVRDHIQQRMRTWAAPYSSELNTVQLDVMHAYKQTGHAGAYCSADGGYLQAHLPYYLKPVFSAAFSTNFKLRNHHRLMRAMIHRLNPAVARLPTDSGGPAGPWRWRNVHRFAPYYAQLGRRAINKIGERLIGRPVWPISGVVRPWLRQASARYVAELELRPETMLSGHLYDGGRLGAAMAKAQSEETTSEAIGRIVTIELALRAVQGSTVQPGTPQSRSE
jgi:hypothetical protein